jgi:hypothetical protein
VLSTFRQAEEKLAGEESVDVHGLETMFKGMIDPLIDDSLSVAKMGLNQPKLKFHGIVHAILTDVYTVQRKK